MTWASTIELLNPALPWLVVAIAVLELLEVGLLDSRAVSFGGPLIAATACVMGPWQAVLVGLGGMTLASCLRGHHSSAIAPARRMIIGLAAIGLSLLAAILTQGMPQVVQAVVVSAVFVTTEYLLINLVGRASLSYGFAFGLRTGAGVLMAAQVSACVLFVLVWGEMGVWSILPAMALLLLMRQSLSLLVDMRRTYLATLEVIAEAVDGDQPGWRGHSSRVMSLSCSIARRAGVSASDLERLCFVALLHDLGISADHGDGTGNSASVMSDVQFLGGVVPIIELLRGMRCGESLDEIDSVFALAVAAADDIDVSRTPATCRHPAGAFQRVSEKVSPHLVMRVADAVSSLGHRSRA